MVYHDAGPRPERGFRFGKDAGFYFLVFGRRELFPLRRGNDSGRKGGGIYSPEQLRGKNDLEDFSWDRKHLRKAYRGDKTMNRRFESHPFWGFHSPLSALAGLGLIIIASTMLASALLCAGTVIWVYALTALIFSGARGILPSRGAMVVPLFLSGFLCGVFMLLVSLLNPLLITGAGFLLILVPSFCVGSGYFEAADTVDPAEAVSRALLEAITLSGIIIALALIREPLGMGTLSLPGGAEGIVELFHSREEGEIVVPLRLFSVSSGALLLLGYGIALYRYFKEQHGSASQNSTREET